MPKIIQIAVAAGEDGGSDTVFALLDNGEVWYLYAQSDTFGWRSKLPPIPQETSEGEGNGDK